MTNQEEKLVKTARTLLANARKALAAELPALLPALYLLPEQPAEEPGTLRTDGTALYFHPRTVVENHLKSKTALKRQLLHVVLHALMGHCFRRRGQEKELFDAAADCKVAWMMIRLSEGGGVTGKNRSFLCTMDKMSLDNLCLLRRDDPLTKKILEAGTALRVDDHSAWDNASPGAGSGGGSGGAAERLRLLWESTARQAAGDLARMGHGDLAGAVSELYRESEPSAVSYREFLLRFRTLSEQQVVDPDSIDRRWYHLGLELLGDTPIVEPEELKEDAPDRLRLAVGLDTSGSCGGEVMRGFLRELLAVLRDAGGPRVTLTLIQCDAEIRSVRTLTAEDAAEELIGGMEIEGFGGTDFCPVFDYVDRENREGEDAPFRGLLYLSDGMGTFPAKAPDYPVYFLFPRQEDGCGPFGEEFGHLPFVPKWVRQVVITEDSRLVIRE